jgi:hypothetical protein
VLATVVSMVGEKADISIGYEPLENSVSATAKHDRANVSKFLDHSDGNMNSRTFGEAIVRTMPLGTDVVASPGISIGYNRSALTQ